QGCRVRRCEFRGYVLDGFADFDEGDDCVFENNKIILESDRDRDAVITACMPNRVRYENNTVEGGKIDDVHWDYMYRSFRFPNTENYLVLQGDFHIHTSEGSDGNMSLERIFRAYGFKYFDVIAVTDHGPALCERRCVRSQREEAAKLAEEHGIIYMPGFETGFCSPNGREHIVVFDTDARPRKYDHNLTDDLSVSGFLKRLKDLRKKGAFIIWPHPNSDWSEGETPGELVRKSIEKAIKKGYIRGVEIINGDSDYDPFHWWATEPIGVWGEEYELKGPRGVWSGSRVMDYALEHNLTLFANSDVHKCLVPCCTLILATERTREGVREALEAGRTAAYSDDMLWAQPDVAEELMNSFVAFKRYTPHEKYPRVKAAFTNNSPMLFMAEIEGETFALRPHETMRLYTEPEKKLKVKWANVFVGTNKCYEKEY
ncbi:MAG: hypothetical protein IJT09_03865, partial [Abditibacteriota bacterium]|nr:hypothetical protein [Abditibacteriota bacterium]